MFITCLIDPSVYGGGSMNENKKIVIDIDPHDEIENAKILVTLKLTEIDPSGLQVYYRGRKIANSTKILSMNLQPDEFFVIKRNTSGGCNLI